MDMVHIFITSFLLVSVKAQFLPPVMSKEESYQFTERYQATRKDNGDIFSKMLTTGSQ